MAEMTETELKTQLLEAELKLQNTQSEFNKQRSKFKDILLTQESELKLQLDKIDALSADNTAYQKQLEITNQEHSEAIEMLKLSQSMDEQEYNHLRNTLEQEQTSLRQTYYLQLQEYQAQLQMMSVERGKWISERNNLIQELSKLKSSLDPTPKAKATLEDEMTRAQEESSKLKNVVLPLEREIASLKKQLEQYRREVPQAAQTHDNLINFESDTQAPPKQESDGFLSTILSSSDVDSARSVSAFDPLFESSSIGVVQQILDISQGSSELDTKRDTQERIRGLEGEVRDCQLRCTKYEGLLDDLRAENYELTDKSATLTEHLSRINREMNKLKSTSRKFKDLLVHSQISLSDRPADFSQLDWDIIQEYIKESLTVTPNSPGGEEFPLLTDSPVRFKLAVPLSDSRLCTTPELNNRLAEATDDSAVSIVREELVKTKTKLEEMERDNKRLGEQVDSLQSSRGPGSIETSQTQKQMTFLKVTVDQQKSSLQKERRLRTEMRKEVNLHLSNLKSIEEAYSDKEKELKELLGEMREELGIAKKDAQQQIAALMNDREKLLLRIRRLEEEYAALVARREGELKSYSAQLNEEKFRKSEAESNVAALQEELVVVQDAKSKQHSEFGSKLTHRADLISQLQSDKDKTESNLAEEVSVLTRQLSQLRTQLEIVQNTKGELLSENHRLETEFSASTKKMEQEITRLTDANNILTPDLENKISLLEEKEAGYIRLKTELNTSEEVQRDFVRLSQRLQKQVAELEDDKKVLVWDYEDDTLQCRNCNQAFNMTRRKHRCRHCCRLFCHECSQWTAENQQNKESRVCEACSKQVVSSGNVTSGARKKRSSTVGESAKSN